MDASAAFGVDALAMDGAFADAARTSRAAHGALEQGLLDLETQTHSMGPAGPGRCAPSNRSGPRPPAMLPRLGEVKWSRPLAKTYSCT